MIRVQDVKFRYDPEQPTYAVERREPERPPR